MRGLKIFDVTSRGSAYTLYPACVYYKADPELMKVLLDVVEYLWRDYEHYGFCKIELRSLRPDFPKVLVKEQFIDAGFEEEYLEHLINKGYIEEIEGKNSEPIYKLSDLSLKVFRRARDINYRLEKEGFWRGGCIYSM